MCLGSPIEQQHGGPAKDSREYYRKEWSPSPLPSVPVSDQESPKGMWLVLGPHHGDFHSQRSWCSVRGLMEARVSQEIPQVSRES